MNTIYLLATDPRVQLLSDKARWGYVQHLAWHDLLSKQDSENETLIYAELWHCTYNEAEDLIWTLKDLSLWGGL